jgi:hypothetical protein
MQEDESDDEDEDGDEERDETAVAEMEMSRMAEGGKNVAEDVQANVWQRSWIRMDNAGSVRIMLDS